MKLRTTLALVLVAVTAAMLPASALPASTKVTVHYQRFAADYTGWNLWLWPKGGNGAAYQFSGTDAFGVSGTFTVPGTAKVEEIGIIVRLNEWLAKDVTDDRFITKFESDGSAEIWLIQGDPTIYYTKPNIEPSIMSARVDDVRSIAVMLNRPLTPTAGASGFTISGPGSPVVQSVASKDGSKSSIRLMLTLGADLALDGTYTLAHPDFGSRTMVLGDVLASKAFSDRFTYTGNDLGNTYAPTRTSFRLWAPTAAAAKLLVYPTPDKSKPTEVEMTASASGTWVASLDGDRNGTIYNYAVLVGGGWQEAVDPYVRATTINGLRGVVVDLAKTNPATWTSERPAFSGNPTDAVFYELHVRDLSMDAASGVPAAHKGRFLALTDHGTRTPDGKTSTGIDAIKALGVTHVQLLPVYDFKTVDETRSDEFNWGYDPLNYNVPEGSYSTDAADPVTRIRELKQTIQSLHGDGLRVVMDVVYNHVFDAGASSFEQLVPGYFFRMNADGTYGNATGVGNEVASERSMARKFILDSVQYWTREYHLDGFRFDLMGVLDVTTMQQVRSALDAIDPSILVIGEGWNMGNLLPSNQRAGQMNADRLPRIGQFNDGIRDGIKGSVFNATEGGYAQGVTARIGAVQSGIVGNVPYASGIGGTWGDIQPGQSVNYVEAHDNLTLYDKLVKSMPKAGAAERSRVFRLASSIALLAQGSPVMQAGQEFMRSKNGDENSYKSPDNVNSLKWSLRQQNMSTVQYFTGLIALRKAHPAFRMSSADLVRANLRFRAAPSNVISYVLQGSAVKDAWRTTVVAHNPNSKPITITLPQQASWKVVVNGMRAGVSTLQTLANAKVAVVPAQSTLVLHS